MEYIILKEVVLKGNRCEYVCEFPNSLSKYLVDVNQNLFIELPAQYEANSVPKGILTIPFVGSFLCVSMMFNVGIKVPVLDKTFFESLSSVKDAYKKMYPYAEFCFDVLPDKIVDCTYDVQQTPSIFFTGGLDATSALIDRIAEKPLLVNIWGGDLLLNDVDAHRELSHYFDRLTKQIGNQYVFVKSNCRRYFNEIELENRLAQLIKPEHNHGWWASIAHILSMTTVIAPIEYLTRTGLHYIGSGYASNSIGFDANNLDMVKSIRYASCRFYLVDDNLDRNDKAKKIIDYCSKANLKVELKVCWYSTASHNCSHCEKCYRTMLNILSHHGDPNDYGFVIDSKGYKRMHRFAKYHEVNKAFWEENKKEFEADADYWRKNKDMSWILDIEFNNPKRLAIYKVYSKARIFLGSIKRRIIGG